jgi:Rhodanese-like domain
LGLAASQRKGLSEKGQLVSDWLADVVSCSARAVSSTIFKSFRYRRRPAEYPESPYHDKNFEKGKTVILYCASGGRAALAGKLLKDMGYDRVYNVWPGLHVQYDAPDTTAHRDEDQRRPKKRNRQKNEEQTARPFCASSHYALSMVLVAGRFPRAMIPGDQVLQP